MTDRHDESMDARQAQDELLVTALAGGRSDEEAAALAGCSARTVRRRRHDDPEFNKEVARRRAERVATLTGRFIDLGDRAHDVLAGALEDEAPRVRLRAAEVVLSAGARLRRATEVDDQINELRALADAYAEGRAADAHNKQRRVVTQ